MNEFDLRKQKRVTVDGGETPVDVKPVLSGNSTVTNIPASLSEVVIQAQNSLRRELTIHNNSNGILYVLLGAGVTSTNYTYKLSREDYVIIDHYRGAVNGVFTNATGFAMVTENYY